MTDYRHELRFGVFLTPRSDHPDEVVALAGMAEDAGIDLVTFQDHPYQPAFVEWLPTLGYQRDVAASNAAIDEAAQRHGTFDKDGKGDLVGSPDAWIERFTDLATTHGFSTFILSGDDPGQIERFTAEVAPVVRQRVGAMRSG